MVRPGSPAQGRGGGGPRAPGSLGHRAAASLTASRVPPTFSSRWSLCRSSQPVPVFPAAPGYCRSNLQTHHLLYPFCRSQSETGLFACLPQFRGWSPVSGDAMSPSPSPSSKLACSVRPTSQTLAPLPSSDKDHWGDSAYPESPGPPLHLGALISSAKSDSRFQGQRRGLPEPLLCNHTPRPGRAPE